MNQLQFLSVDTKTVKLRIKKHANKRLVQRFRLFLRPEEIEAPKYFIERIFRKSSICKKHMFSPFIFNKKSSLYGVDNFYCNYGMWRLSCILNRDKSVTITTVMKRNAND